MFRQIRFQTGELDEIVDVMKKGGIPSMDVDDNEEFEWFVSRLSKSGIFRVEGMQYDKNAKDRVKEPEFEFRAAFSPNPVKATDVSCSDLMFLDVYFEPQHEETYDSISEI